MKQREEGLLHSRGMLTIESGKEADIQIERLLPKGVASLQINRKLYICGGYSLEFLYRLDLNGLHRQMCGPSTNEEQESKFLIQWTSCPSCRGGRVINWGIS